MEEQKPKESLTHDFIENFTKEWNEVTVKFKEYYKREKRNTRRKDKKKCQI